MSAGLERVCELSMVMKLVRHNTEVRIESLLSNFKGGASKIRFKWEGRTYNGEGGMVGHRELAENFLLEGGRDMGTLVLKQRMD